MKVVICPTNLQYMPYLQIYENNISDATLLIWDRFQLEKSLRENSKYIYYKDLKCGHRRGFLDYLKFSLWVARWIKKNSTPRDFYLLFTFQLVFFLWPTLLLKKINFAIDIRDFHLTAKLIPSTVFKKARFIASSSPGYYKYLPMDSNKFISHNFIDPRESDKQDAPFSQRGRPYVISCIGSIADFYANYFLLHQLSSVPGFIIEFHGYGPASEKLQVLATKLNAENISFTGFYEKSAEPSLYKKSTMINLLMDERRENSKHALANRLYNAVYHRIPLLCFEGSLCAEYINKYNLGLCVTRDGKLPELISHYFENFDAEVYEAGAKNFFKLIKEEQEIFKGEVMKHFTL